MWTKKPLRRELLQWLAVAFLWCLWIKHKVYLLFQPSLRACRFSIMSRCIFYSQGKVIEKIYKKKRRNRRSWELPNLPFLYNQESLNRELLPVSSRKSLLDANPRPRCMVFFFQEKYTFSKRRCFSKAKGGRKELFSFSGAILPPKEKLLKKHIDHRSKTKEVRQKGRSVERRARWRKIEARKNNM